MGIKAVFSHLKGALCSSGEEIQTQNINICYNTNSNMYFVPPHNCINKLFSEENKVPEHCLKLERWQGPPRQQSKTV